MIRAVLFSALLLSGCGVISMSNNEPPIEIQPTYDFQDTYMIKAYETAATRAANKMLDDTADIYESVPKPKLYVKEIVKKDSNLPDGFYTARRAIKEIAGKSGTYVLVNDMTEADYMLDNSISAFNSAGLPAILFRMSLNNKDDEPIRAWTVVIRQMAEDQSWW